MTEVTAKELQYEKVSEHMLSIKKILPFIVIVAAVLLLEATVFQYRFFHPIMTGAEQKAYNSYNVTVSGATDLSSVTGNVTVTINNIGTKVTSVTLDAVGEYNLTASWLDESSTKSRKTGVKQSMHQSTKRGNDYYLTTKGECKQLVLSIESNSPVNITGIKLNYPTYNVRWLRVVILSLSVIGVYMLFKRKPWHKELSHTVFTDKVYNSFPTVGMVYIIFMLAILLLSPGMETNTEHCSISKLVYSIPDRNDAYMMQTDALAKGQAKLDIIPSDELLNFDNPYDPSARNGISYIWDFAFYDGAYYSYFGIVPVVLILLPFRLITGQFLSSYVFSFMLGVSAAVVLCFLYREAVRRFIPKLSVFAYHTGLIAVLSCSFLAYLSARSWFYEIPYNSSLLCIFLSLYFALRYDRANHKRMNLVLTGLTYALSVGCRPIALISILLIAPIILENIGKNYLSAVYFAIPTVTVGVLLGVWNIIRFDSFFDFGNAYQLTVSDIRYNSFVDLPVTFDGAFRYLFGEVKFNNVFPFFFAKLSDITDMSHVLYSQPVTGLIRYPIYLCAGLIPLLFRRDRRFGVFAVCGVVAGILTILAVSASGGVCERYTLDFRWIFALIGTLCALKLMSEYGEKRTSFNLLFGLAVTASAVISLAICITGEFNRIANVYESIYLVMRDTFEILY